MKTFLPIVALFYILGCQGISTHSPKPMSVISHADTVKLSNEQAVKHSLYSQLESWKGTTYQFGGLSKKGIDCSGFVYLTYLSKFGIQLPRSTNQQAHVGWKVSQNKLQPGDLVFFQTGLSTKHVGIFIEDRKFVHASKSRGIIVSSLDNEYWSKRYWKATRIRMENVPT